jgi:hypothetical protein
MQGKNKHSYEKVVRKRAKGQTMALVGILLALGVLVGLVAIAFDGGSALLQRRVMQNSAQAGALAGGDLMTNNLAASCNPAPCHPSYLITNQQLLDQVNALANANHQGTVGATSSDYTTVLEYHYMAGQVPSGNGCPEPGHSQGYCPPPQNPIYPFVPDFVDGLRVTTSINNPTTFARAIPNPLNNLQVGAKAAVRLYPSCPPDTPGGYTLPFTRYRPAVEKELYDASQGNSICHVFPFWTSQPDVGSNIKNVMSFDHDTLNPHQNISQQMISGFDTRAGPSPPNPPQPEGGLSNYDHANLFRTYQTCTAEPCVNLYNAGAPQGGNITGPPSFTDLANWIFWQWRGTISTTTTVWNNTANSETLYPSTRQNGANGNVQRVGDWAEMSQITGSGGQNVQAAVHDLADQYGTITSLSGGILNWGRAITRTVYVWGEPAPDPTNGNVTSDAKSAQVWDNWDHTQNNLCNGGGSPDTFAWTDLNITGNYPNSGPNYSARNVSCGNQGPNSIDRVRFTYKYTFVFYANLQGNNYGANNAPGCPPLPNPGSAAWGILPDASVQDPPPGSDCPTGWVPGGGVFSRQVDPGG